MKIEGIKGGLNLGGGRQRPLFVSQSVTDTRSEHEIQSGFFVWLRLNEETHPVLSRVFAIPNGGHRAKATAIKLKREGVKAGVLDVHLPVARQGFTGLWLEFKSSKGTLSATQREWKAFLESENHLVIVPRTWMDAARAVVSYLSLTSYTPIPNF